MRKLCSSCEYGVVRTQNVENEDGTELPLIEVIAYCLLMDEFVGEVHDCTGFYMRNDDEDEEDD